MRDALLKIQGINEADVDWLYTVGHQQEITPGTKLTTQGEPVDFLYIVLEGMLAAIISTQGDDPLARAFSALEGEQASGMEIARFKTSEVVDELAVLDHRAAATTIKVLRRTVVLAIPWQQLTMKLEQDPEFASRFNLALAICLSSRLRDVIITLNSRKTAIDFVPSLRKVLFVFQELNDSDIDWMGRVGKREQLHKGVVLIKEGEPIDAFYILLDGSLQVSAQANTPLNRVYGMLEGRDLDGQKIASLSKGEIMGEMSFLENHPSYASFITLENSLVLAIPRQYLAIKLEQDPGFASRFYRAIAVLLADRLRRTISQIGSYRQTYHAGQSLSQDGENYEDELDFDLLEQIELAGIRLDWMLSRLRDG